MYHLHCDSCHHEWDSGEKMGKCDWCGGGSRILSEFTWKVDKIFEAITEMEKNRHKIRKSGLYKKSYGQTLKSSEGKDE